MTTKKNKPEAVDVVSAVVNFELQGRTYTRARDVSIGYLALTGMKQAPLIRESEGKGAKLDKGNVSRVFAWAGALDTTKQKKLRSIAVALLHSDVATEEGRAAYQKALRDASAFVENNPIRPVKGKNAGKGKNDEDAPDVVALAYDAIIAATDDKRAQALADNILESVQRALEARIEKTEKAA